MQKLKIRQGDWVVVCDGKKALVLENIGDEKFLNLKTREVREHADLKTHELGTDQPGRSFSSVGTGRSAMEQTDWHTQEEDKFLHKLAGHLDAAPALLNRIAAGDREACRGPDGDGGGHSEAGRHRAMLPHASGGSRERDGGLRCAE